MLPAMVYWAYSASVRRQPPAALVVLYTGNMSCSNFGHISFARGVLWAVAGTHPHRGKLCGIGEWPEGPHPGAPPPSALGGKLTTQAMSTASKMALRAQRDGQARGVGVQSLLRWGTHAWRSCASCAKEMQVGVADLLHTT